MKCNYDRYRIIVQNDCARITEEAALKQIDIDEKFGDVSKNTEQEDKKKYVRLSVYFYLFTYGAL